ncbi:hypothetical protein [Phenylobacterium sp.]|uniref:DUF7662 domain-containing protein n=1 Tax=Phenylobacterium sp. TaxID=1871053 RepID=UPI0035B4E374
MSKYRPLSERLAAHEGPEWRASFAEVEEVLGFPLPKGARTGRAWWAGEDKPHAKSWTQHGFQAEADPQAGWVTFRRGDISPAAVEAVLEPPSPEDVQRAAHEIVAVAEEAPATSEPARKIPPAGIAALAAGGVALAAGLGAVLLRGLARRR